MSFVLILIGCVILAAYAMCGYFLYDRNREPMYKAWKNGKHIRCAVLAFLCGPIVWLFKLLDFVLFVSMLTQIIFLYILQEVPDSGESKDELPSLVRYPRPTVDVENTEGEPNEPDRS